MKFVDKSNLPIRTGTVILGSKYADLLSEKLSVLQVSVLPMPENPDVDERVSAHADLSVLHLGGKHLLLAPYLKGSIFAKDL